MRVLKRFVSALVVIVALLVAVAFVLPREVTVEREISINAAPDAVFPYVNSMQKTEKWSPWLERDPDVVLTYEGPETGVGNKLTWASDDRQVGNGTQIITASAANERVDTDLDFGPMGTAKAWFVLTPEGEATKLTWGFVTDLGMNPMSRWMGLMMGGWVGGDYEKGLSNLKGLIEAG